MNNYMENEDKDKREFRRFETRLQISLFYGHLVYSGIVTNISERGMFISTKRRFPVDSMLVTSLIGDEPIQVPVQIKRMVSPVNTRDAGEYGIGVHILRGSSDYLDFFGNHMSRQMKFTL